MKSMNYHILNNIKQEAFIMHKKKGHGHGHSHGHGKVLGTTTMGERGQIVIPSEAREELEIQPGEKFIVFGNKRKGAVILVKSETFNKFADFFMSASSKFEKIAKEIYSKTNADDEIEEDDEFGEE